MSTADDLRDMSAHLRAHPEANLRDEFDTLLWLLIEAFSKSADDLAEAGRNDKHVVRAADDGAGKGSTAARTGARSDAQPAEAPGEGRSEMGPQKGVQSLGGDLREFAAQMGAVRDEFVTRYLAARADALTTEQQFGRGVLPEREEPEDDQRVQAWYAIWNHPAIAGHWTDEETAIEIVFRRLADLTQAEAAVARVRALLDRPLIPSALLRDALDDHQQHDERPASGAGMEEM